MKDRYRTNLELIEEISVLKQKIQDLKQSESVRKQTEEAQRESEARYRSLFENNHAVMLLIDPDNAAITDANTAACAYYGWSREELMKRRIDEINTLTSEEDSAEMQLARSEKRNHFIFKHRRADGTIRDVEVYSGPILLKGKSLLYSIVHDITERKQAEAKLRESGERFRALSENAPDIIYTMNLLGAITYVNPSWKRILDHDKEEILGRYLIEFAKEEEKRTYRKLFKSIRDEGKSVNNHIGVMLKATSSFGPRIVAMAILRFVES